MSIIKSKHASNFTVISNDVFKCGLSIEAIGLLAYFLSLPHDWVIYKTKLHDQLNMGREKLDRIFKELQEAGYILSVKRQQESGRFEHEHIVYDKPYNGEPDHGLPPHGEPDTALPDMANQPLLNTKEQSTKEQKKKEKRKLKEHECTPSTLGSVKPEHLQTFYIWLEYKKKHSSFYTDQGLQILIKKINSLSVEQFNYVCDLSIMNNWQGLFFEKVCDMPVKKHEEKKYVSNFKDLDWNG